MESERQTVYYVRCMGGRFCNHAPGKCTASDEYQAVLAAKKALEPAMPNEPDEKLVEQLRRAFEKARYQENWGEDYDPDGDLFDVAADRIEQLSAELAEAREIIRGKADAVDLEQALLTALHDAINAPKGVVPASAERFYDQMRCP